MAARAPEDAVERGEQLGKVTLSIAP